MKLERLEVIGFGRLRDLRLELAPRLTVLLGDNEAGKSTVLRALRAALYGLDAGGQGRAIAASEWSRWAPWDGRDYGLSLVYSLADGRRFRVTRRLRQREQPTQVQELGGRDVTEEMRVGRHVLPGRYHLGVDEPVFCATAWVGEEGLRLDAPEAPQAQAERLQETIERLADSASRATAAEALGRLRQAMERIGTEQRRQSPLGRATARLRELEEQIARARRLADAVGREQDELLALERRAAEAEASLRAAEVAWLRGRLAVVRHRRRETAIDRAKATRLEQLAADLKAYAAFPSERETLVVTLGAELRHALGDEAAAVARWEEAKPRLADVERRRREIAAGIQALGPTPPVDDEVAREAAGLRAEVDAAAVAEREALDAVRQATARVAALRTEIAATGLGSVPVGQAEVVADLVQAALAPQRAARRLRPVAEAVGALGLLAGGGLWVLGHHVAAGAALLMGAIVVVALLGVGHLRRDAAAEARRHLRRRCPGLDLGDPGLRRVVEHLDTIRRLHGELQGQEALIAATRERLAAVEARLADLAERCAALADRLRLVKPTELPDTPTPGSWAARCLTLLGHVEGALVAGRRRVELEDEDLRLRREELDYRALAAAAEEARRRRDTAAAALERELAAAGVAFDPDPDRCVAAFGEACARRRRYQAAIAELHQLRQRIAARGGDDDHIAAEEHSLLAELSRRGAEPPHADLPPPAAELARLEGEVEHARRLAAAAQAQASERRARLDGALDPLGDQPTLADLEDERGACLAVRERCLRQLEALRRAGEAIETAARRVHRDIAPRLAESVGERLFLLTGKRYLEVNVDAERFAVGLRGVERPDYVPLDLVSRGTRDQVSLLLRLALVEVLGDTGEPVPLLLDDPVLSADQGRRRAAVDFLLGLSVETQVVLATSDPAIAAQVEAGGDGGCAVVRLAPPLGAGTPSLSVLPGNLTIDRASR